MASGRRVTLNEVLRLSRRVFLALGVAPGCEREPAEAVTWLEARGLSGLATLVADLPRLRGAARQVARITVEDERGAGRLCMDAAPAVAPLVILGAVDWLVSRPEGACVRIVNTASPLWGVALLAERGPEGPCWLQARGADDALQLVFHGSGDGGPNATAAVALPSLAGAATVLTMGSGAPPRPEPVPTTAMVLDAATLNARYRDSLQHGLHADPALWDRLAAVARESLVPESEASRVRGAGGGDDNA